MERKIAIVLFLFIFCTMAYSQDILTMKSGEQSVVKIEGISDEVITYKLWSNLNGPTRTTSIKKVKSVQYANGQIETFLSDREKEDLRDEEAARVRDSLSRANFVPKLVIGTYAGAQLCRMSIHPSGDSYDIENGYKLSPMLGVSAIWDLTFVTSLYGGVSYSVEGGHFEDYNSQEYRCNYVAVDAGICCFERSCVIAFRTAFLTSGHGYENGVKYFAKENYTPVRCGLYIASRHEFGNHKQHEIDFYTSVLFSNVMKPDMWKSGNHIRTSNTIWGIKYSYNFLSKELRRR